MIGLTAATTYHYRLIARNADGTTTGGDRSFKTANQPLGFSLGGELRTRCRSAPR